MMPKTIQEKHIPLNKLVQTTDWFARSLNVERDGRNPESINMYVPSALTIDTIKRLILSMSNSSSNAFSITGPYGSGKSTLAVFLDGLFASKNSTMWKNTSNILNSNDPKLVRQLIAVRESTKVHTSGFITCFVTAKREPLTLTILRALDIGARKYFKGNYSGKSFPTAKKLQETLKKTLDTDHMYIPKPDLIFDILVGLCSKSTVILLIDEFGKNLEYFAESQTIDKSKGDLFILQEIAESSHGEKRLPIFLLTLQHMAFENYSTNPSHQKEWTKIQGRFEDIVFYPSDEQIYALTTKVLKRKSYPSANKQLENWAKYNFTKLNNLNLDMGITSQILNDCYPLHPLSLLVLPDLCRLYGQHERTLLSFMLSSEKNTVHQFITKNKIEHKPPTVTVDQLFDYFIAIHHSTYQKFDSARLTEIKTIIRDSHGLTELELKLIKIIGLLNLVTNSGYLRASKQILEYAIGCTIQKTLDKLEKKSIITYRSYADEYRIWHGSDIDLNALIEQTKQRHKSTPLINILNRVYKLEPILAARHGIHTGTMRIFERNFFDPDQKEIITPKEYSHGIILYNTNDEQKSIHIKLNKPTIIVTPNNLNALHHLAINAVAIKEIIETNQNAKDWVIRSELFQRLNYTMSRLENEFENTFEKNAMWRYLGDSTLEIGVNGQAASTVSDKVYNKGPRIYNEILNCLEISSQGTRARLQLLYALVEKTDVKSFGIDGWGPERAMYEAVFAKTHLHKKENNAWKLSTPSTDLLPVWNELLRFFQKAKKSRLSLDIIYNKIESAPYGVLHEVSPVLILSAIMYDRDKIAIYEHGTYCPELLEPDIERLVKNPQHFEIKYIANEKISKQVLEDISAEFEGNMKKRESNLLNIVRVLITMAINLPKYTKNTKSLTPRDQKILQSVLTATEPDVLIFETLPSILSCKISTQEKFLPKGSKKYAKLLYNTFEKLQQVFPNRLEEMRTNLLASFNYNDRKHLSEIMSVLKNKIADQTMKNFLSAITTDALGDDEWIEYIGMIVTTKPPSDWTDEDSRKYDLLSKQFLDRLKRFSALTFDETRKIYNSQIYRIAITHSNGTENINVVSLDKSLEKKINNMLKKNISDLSSKKTSKQDVHRAIMAVISKNLSGEVF